MQARIARQGEITVVYLSGRVDVETAEPFRKACLEHLNKHKVVFDFNKLSFVGSSGILPFLETMQQFAALNPGGCKFSGVGIEFARVLSATPLSLIERHETSEGAVSAYLNPTPAFVVQPAPILPDAVAPAAEFLSFRALPEEGIETSEDDLDQ